MQFSIPKDTRVFLRTGVTDLRLGFEGLRTLVANVIRQEPTGGHLFVWGHLFVFCNRARNRIRCLFWDGSGLWVATKRLEAGTFDWPKQSRGGAEVSARQLQLLLEGIELRERKGWYRRK